MIPNAQKLYEVTDATWPAARDIPCGPFTLREGLNGGQRVSSATVNGAFDDADIARAEGGMRAMGQPLIFQIREGDDALDAALDARGYVVHDPVNLYAITIADLPDLPRGEIRAYEIWEPLQLQLDMWKDGGIGPGRIAVMLRASMPKTSILTRWDQNPAGTAYVGIHDGISMIHAIEIRAEERRKGVASQIMLHAASWAKKHGADVMSLVTTQGNTAANRLYASLGMTLVGQYHYRLLKES